MCFGPLFVTTSFEKVARSLSWYIASTSLHKVRLRSFHHQPFIAEKCLLFMLFKSKFSDKALQLVLSQSIQLLSTPIFRRSFLRWYVSSMDANWKWATGFYSFNPLTPEPTPHWGAKKKSIRNSKICEVKFVQHASQWAMCESTLSYWKLTILKLVLLDFNTVHIWNGCLDLNVRQYVSHASRHAWFASWQSLALS